MSEWRDGGRSASPPTWRRRRRRSPTPSAAVDLETLRRGTIVFAGIGASAHALIPSVLALRAAGRRAFALQATELR